MFQSFTIKNFRCFHDITIAPLERVNIIAGMNNVGKTALLEALFLHLAPNNPELPLRVHVFRGINQFALDAKEIWSWLFYGKKTNEAIELISLDEAGKRCSLQLRLEESQEARPNHTADNNTDSPEIIGSLSLISPTPDLILKYKDSNGQTHTSRAITSDEGINFKRAQLSWIPNAISLSTRARNPKEDSERFSKLDAKGRQSEILTTMQILEPRLKRLAILVRGGAPMVNGDIGIGELVPLPLMGEGIVRLLSIVLAIADASGGTVLIDEIENGLHYSVMTNVWKAIAMAARQSNTQVFATTHSWECIHAANEAFATEGVYDFRLHRLDRIDDKVGLISYDQEMLSTAIATDLEVR